MDVYIHANVRNMVSKAAKKPDLGPTHAHAFVNKTPASQFGCLYQCWCGMTKRD